MKFLTNIILFLASLNYLSCTDGSSSNNEKSSDSESVDSDIATTKQLTTHIIDVKCEGEFIPLRNRILSKNELALSQKGNATAKQLNDEVIIDRLYNGEWIKLIKADTLGYHYVQVIDRINRFEMSEQRNTRGFIISQYCGQPTVREMKEIRISKFAGQNDDIKNTVDFLTYHSPNSGLLDYAYAYISQEADIIQVLSFNITGIDEIRFKFYLVINQSDDLLFSGSAQLIDAVVDSNGQEYSRYFAFDIMGHKSFEIHISSDNKNAFLRFNDSKGPIIFQIPNEFLIEKMNRIK